MKQIWKDLGAWEKAQCVLMAVLALMGVLLAAVRVWGMRFSGFLLLGAAVLLVLELWLGRPPVQNGLVVAPGVPGCGGAGAGPAGAHRGRGDRRGAPPDCPGDAGRSHRAGGRRQRHRPLAVPQDPAGCGAFLSGGVPGHPGGAHRRSGLRGGDHRGGVHVRLPDGPGRGAGAAHSGGGRLQHRGEF